ncbi:MAG: type II toxin-antitoxin system RelE/ParE family toxin [Pirellulaceae bacterium]|nr:type II toxin-antitoxin system RelE/ParE family toxin [Pirellulaceae bacterium]
MKAILTPETESDLLRGIEWFDRIAPGLGDQFELEFFNALNRIKQGPNLFSANHTGYRPCRLKRFTAVIYFRIDGDFVVVVGLFTSGEDESALNSRE